MIEQIAQRWFETEPCTGSPKWDAQPESVKAHFRAKAEQFWREPGALTRVLQQEAIRSRQSLSLIERSTKAWA